MYLYIKYSIHNGRISAGYWRAPKNNPYTGFQSTFLSGMLLQTPFSYLDGPQFTYLMKQMVERLGMNLYIQKPLTHPVTQGRLLPTIYIWRILQDHVLIDHLLGVFYPATTNQEMCRVLFISSAMENLFNSSVQSVIDSIREHVHHYDFQTLHMRQKSYFSSLIMLSIYMYAAHNCPDSFTLGKVVLDLHNQFNVLNRAKDWVSRVLTQEIQVTPLPSWLRDTMQRNINTWI